MNSAQPPRVRFAPSPTGFLHVGAARTALFNWLFVKHHGGIFILRIEDTDQQRSFKKFEDNIFEGLRWLGLFWDEGPDKPGAAKFYRQSERNLIYKNYVQRLLDSGCAYYCYCDHQRLEELRKKAEAEKKPFIYDGHCRNLSEEEKKKFHGIQPVVRFKTVPRLITVNDLIKGAVNFDLALIGDQIIFKSDGTPTYNFACVVDDIEMGITHIIRGEDHLSNTPKQIIIYEAFEKTLPQFAHIPMILGPDRSKLSKRHGAVAVTQYRDEGFLAETFFNYLALVGWSPGDDREIMSREEIIESFSVEKISKSAAIFDLTKLKWLNGIYIRQKLGLASLIEKFQEEAKTLNLLPQTRQVLPVIAEGYRNQIELLSEIKEIILKVNGLIGNVRYDPEVQKKILGTHDLDRILKQMLESFKKLPDYSPKTIEIFLEEFIQNSGLSRGKLYRPLRFILSGSEVFPEIQYVLAFLGPEESSKRIEYFLNLKENIDKGGGV
jgi:glutamyl-tRNA synthetase/nondiscriminating glutamyl-tRNA synthetase